MQSVFRLTPTAHRICPESFPIGCERRIIETCVLGRRGVTRKRIVRLLGVARFPVVRWWLPRLVNQPKSNENLNVRVGREQPARSLNVKFGISVVCVRIFCIFAA